MTGSHWTTVMTTATTTAVAAGAVLGSVAVFVSLNVDALAVEHSGVALSPAAESEIAQVEVEIERIEAQTIERLAAPPDNQVQQIELLGKLMLYDENLSVNRNEACAFCHMPETGFTGPVSDINRTTGSYPGSVRTRYSERKPQTHAYAPLAPVLHYNPGQGDLVGGNFWDMRATGRRLGNPAAEQAEDRQPIPSKWACQTLLAWCIALHSGRIAPCSKAFAANRPSQSHGRTTSNRSATGQGRHRQRSEAGPSHPARSWKGRHDVRSDGAVHRRL